MRPINLRIVIPSGSGEWMDREKILSISVLGLGLKNKSLKQITQILTC